MCVCMACGSGTAEELPGAEEEEQLRALEREISAFDDSLMGAAASHGA
eukprot:COSAG05_NODE_1064_length_5991_cov_12.180414_5_plen_48_part_00